MMTIRPRTRAEKMTGFALAVALTGWFSPEALQSQASEPDDPHLDAAARYAKAFLVGDQPTLEALQDDTMDGAMTADKVEQARKSLSLQFGEWQEVGAAWFADTLQGYRRYRVPAVFARETMDLMIVVDGEGQVAGFTLVPFVEQLLEEPAAPGKEIDFAVGELPGTLIVPEGDGPFSAVVIVHGSGPHDRDGTLGPNKPLRDIAWGLAERGVAALRYEKRSKHAPQSLVSLGDSFTLESETIADAQEAVRALRRHPEVREDGVFVLGHSLGGTAAPRIGRMEPPPAGIVVLAGMTLPFADKFVEQTEYIVNADGLLTDPERQQLESVRAVAAQINAALEDPENAPSGYLLGAPIGYYRDLEQHPPAEIAAESQTPILVLQGDRDYQVTLEDFAVWEDALKDAPFACLVRYPKLNHFFQAGEGPSTPVEYQRRASVASEPLDDVAAWVLRRECASRVP